MFFIDREMIICILQLALDLGEASGMSIGELQALCAPLGLSLRQDYVQELRTRVINGVDLSFSIHLYEEFVFSSSIALHLCHSPLASTCPTCHLMQKV